MGQENNLNLGLNVGKNKPPKKEVKVEYGARRFNPENQADRDVLLDITDMSEDLHDVTDGDALTREELTNWMKDDGMFALTKSVKGKDVEIIGFAWITPDRANQTNPEVVDIIKNNYEQEMPQFELSIGRKKGVTNISCVRAAVRACQDFADTHGNCRILEYEEVGKKSTIQEMALRGEGFNDIGMVSRYLAQEVDNGPIEAVDGQHRILAREFIH